jgi:hypothetical protein
MMAKGKLVAGTKLSPKIQSVYIFGELSMNYYLNESGKDLIPLSSSEESSTTKVSKWWPGFSLGVMLR